MSDDECEFCDETFIMHHPDGHDRSPEPILMSVRLLDWDHAVTVRRTESKHQMCLNTLRWTNQHRCHITACHAKSQSKTSRGNLRTRLIFGSTCEHPTKIAVKISIQLRVGCFNSDFHGSAEASKSLHLTCILQLIRNMLKLAD